MCFSKAASKIPKGEQMPKLTVLVYFRWDRQGESCQGFAWDLQPGSQGQAHKTSLCLGGTLLKEAGDRCLLLLVSSPLGFLPLQFTVQDGFKKQKQKRGANTQKPGIENAS